MTHFQLGLMVNSSIFINSSTQHQSFIRAQIQSHMNRSYFHPDNSTTWSTEDRSFAECYLKPLLHTHNWQGIPKWWHGTNIWSTERTSRDVLGTPRISVKGFKYAFCLFCLRTKNLPCRARKRKGTVPGFL